MPFWKVGFDFNVMTVGLSMNLSVNLSVNLLSKFKKLLKSFLYLLEHTKLLSQKSVPSTHFLRSLFSYFNLLSQLYVISLFSLCRHSLPTQFCVWLLKRFMSYFHHCEFSIILLMNARRGNMRREFKHSDCNDLSLRFTRLDESVLHLFFE